MSLQSWLHRAHKYWNGCDIDEASTEVIFEGMLDVVRKTDINEQIKLHNLQ